MKINILKNKSKKGFTIIEMMVAIAIFLVVVMFGMQALLNANFVHKKTGDIRSILDNLTFALDDMSKNIRVGSSYHCIENDSDFYNITNDEPKSCQDGYGISFEDSKGDSTNGTDQVAYFIGGNSLYRSNGPTYNQGVNDVRMISENIILDEQASGFSILGAESTLDGDKQQPFIVIRLSGEIKGSNNTSTPFSIETAVSQRLIDIESQISNNDNILLPAEVSNLQGALSAEAQLAEAVSQTAESAELVVPQSVESTP